mmetsp:Transcript_20803/g.64509  ORF Transcript_20803/g.64509 Transcript_20803/m.64509 type:complete len:213 (+) Transcript_20803:1377-2015(+)
MSSYDELVQLPMSAELTSRGQPSARARAPRSLTAVHRSGVKGPLMWGPSSLRLISITRSYSQPSSGTRLWRLAAASSATPVRPVSRRYSSWRSHSGKTEVVAPISAPMLVMVAIPVAEMDSTPSPKYSTMAPVPPDTVRMSATLRMTSLGEVQPPSAPVSLTPITLGALSSHAMSAMTSTASAPPTPIAHMPMPPAFGVWLSVPIIRPPGKA